MYKPIYVIQIYENCNESDEDIYFTKYTNEFGKENVRSGSFVEKIIIEEKYIEIYNTSIYSSMCTKYCIKCHTEGHYLCDCGY
jgi:hypothetical protein